MGFPMVAEKRQAETGRGSLSAFLFAKMEAAKAEISSSAERGARFHSHLKDRS